MHSAASSRNQIFARSARMLRSNTIKRRSIARSPPLFLVKDSTPPMWYHSDHLGSIRLMTNASGYEVKDYAYQAFGATQAQSGTERNERGSTGHTLAPHCVAHTCTALRLVQCRCHRRRDAVDLHGARYCAAPRSGAEWVTTPRTVLPLSFQRSGVKSNEAFFPFWQYRIE